MPVESEASQAVLSLHRMRHQLKDMRRMQSNQLKALLYEFGIVAPARVSAAQLSSWSGRGQTGSSAATDKPRPSGWSASRS